VASTELDALREMLVALGRIGPEVPIELQRAAADGFGAASPVADDVELSPFAGDGLVGEWLAAPGSDPERVVLYLHGGGFVIGSPASHRSFAARISAEAGARVLLLDYRLAPEHRFPAALEDAVGACRFLLAAGHRPDAVAVAGDSAGGGLAVATLMALRDEGSHLPAAVVCVSPWVDLRCTAASIEGRDERDYVLSGPWLRAMASHYLDGSDPASPAASPIAGELDGLPPALVVVGTEEVLFDDAHALAGRLRAAGGTVELEVFDQCAHWWMLAGPTVPEATACDARIGTFLRARLA